MAQSVSFTRGRNDRRDGREMDFINTLPSMYNRHEWIAGWEVQESILKMNKMSAITEEGKKAAKNGESEMSNPHPAGTKSHTAWRTGHIIGTMMENNHDNTRAKRCMD